MKHLLKSYTQINNIRIHTTLEFRKDRLSLSFSLEGGLEDYLFPAVCKNKKANELWKATCFELFLASSNEEAYYELNVSPSLEWNFYSLPTYRAEVKEVENVSLNINTFKKENTYEINMTLESDILDFESFDTCNMTAILLTKNRERTFWSLKPMGDVPDFHNKEFFINI